MKIRPVVAQLLHADTDGRMNAKTKTKKLKVAFQQFRQRV